MVLDTQVSWFFKYSILSWRQILCSFKSKKKAHRKPRGLVSYELRRFCPNSPNFFHQHSHSLILFWQCKVWWKWFAKPNINTEIFFLVGRRVFIIYTDCGYTTHIYIRQVGLSEEILLLKLFLDSLNIFKW